MSFGTLLFFVLATRSTITRHITRRAVADGPQLTIRYPSVMRRRIVQRVHLQSAPRQPDVFVSYLLRMSSSNANRYTDTSCRFASIEGLCAAAEAEQTSDSASSETNVRCVILFDNEEVSRFALSLRRLVPLDPKR